MSSSSTNRSEFDNKCENTNKTPNGHEELLEEDISRRRSGVDFEDKRDVIFDWLSLL